MIDRRTFVKACGTSLLAAPAALSALSKPAQPALGVQLYSFREQLKQDAASTLAKVKAMGFTEIEAAGYKWNSAAEFRSLLDKAGLRCVSFFTDYNRMRDDLVGVVKDARTLGSRYVIIGWIPHEKQFSLAECDRAIAHFNDWGGKLSAEGLRFAYHIHGYEFAPQGQGTLFDKLMQETKPENVSIEEDVFWVAHPGHDPVALLKKYAKRIELVHLKDMRKGVKGDLTGKADDETNVTLGTGQIDIAGVVRAARQGAVKYLFIEDESSRSMEQVPLSLKYVQNV